MGSITVTEDTEGSSGIISLPICDIVYIEYDSKIDRVIIHTIDSMYYTVGTLKYWHNALNSSGYNFAAVDRTNVVNLDKLVRLDKVYHVGYFEEVVTETSKRCTFTNINFAKLQRKHSSVPAIENWA